MKKGYIICVDDQPEIVDVLMMQLESAFGETCEIEIAESAEEAFNVFLDLRERGEQVELIITDEIMPGLQGSRFLEMIRQQDPDIMTMMLTGQAGLSDVVYAINKGGLAKCLKKPWEYNELKTTVAELVEKTKVNRRNKQLAQEIVAEKDKAEAIVHSITDGILLIDGDDRISLVNEACVHLLGRAEQELLWTRIMDVPELPKELILLFMKASQRDGEVMSDEIALTRGGVLHYIIAGARTLRSKEGYPLGVVTVLRDITKEKEISVMKANFLSTVSDGLRTPLTPVLATLEMLLQGDLGELNADQRGFIQDSKEQGELLSELIDNLMDVTSLESNRLELTPETVAPADLAAAAAASAAAAARARGLTFALEVDPNLPSLCGDRKKIERMLKMLLSNAVKFTKQGGVTLKIRRVSEWEELAGGKPGERALPVRHAQEGVEFAVIDTGIGIAPDHFEKIFEKFFQVDNSTTREFRGSGIGLSICKAIVQAHHGHIWLESELNRGTTFHVMFPIRSA